MDVRVVVDQPWDVPVDVLVVPIVGDPAFDGPLGELDRRLGGELRALANFKELVPKRFSTSLAAGGESAAGRVLAVGAGEAAELDRETVVRVGATAERRLGGRPVRRVGVWLNDLAATLEGGAAAVAELVVRGVVEGSFDPQTIYREVVEAAPPQLDELILVVPGAGG
ncbi:MAG: M17 family peptidase N-terminal domain-containing protein, partial [Chloroflexota bacterium]